MNTIQSSYARPEMRASDADRDVVLAALSTSFEAGRLTSEEFDERSSQALAARTMGELGLLTADLPSGQPSLRVQPPAQPRQTRRPGPAPVVVAIAAVALVAIVLGSVGHGTWPHEWWLALLALFVIRGAVVRRCPDAFRRHRR